MDQRRAKGIQLELQLEFAQAYPARAGSLD